MLVYGSRDSLFHRLDKYVGTGLWVHAKVQLSEDVGLEDCWINIIDKDAEMYTFYWIYDSRKYSETYKRYSSKDYQLATDSEEIVTLPEYYIILMSPEEAITTEELFRL